MKLDVTSQEDIDAAVETITKAGPRSLWPGQQRRHRDARSHADTSLEEFDLVMDVNVYGPYRVAAAFAPLITASKGRITTIGSISGILARATSPPIR